MTLLLLAGISIACLPKLLIGALIIALFLLILWEIIAHVAPPDIQAYAKWILLIVVLIVILIVLIQLYEYGLNWVC